MSSKLLNALQELLKGEFAEVIGKARGGKGTGAMAYKLLKRDKQNHHLIGVVKQGEMAVFYEPGRWDVVAVLFDESSVDGLSKPRIDKLKRRATVEFFIHEKAEEFWTWVIRGIGRS